MEVKKNWFTAWGFLSLVGEGGASFSVSSGFGNVLFWGGAVGALFGRRKGGGRSERSDSLPVRVGKQFGDILHKVITQNIIIHKDTLDDMDRPQCISGFSSLLHQTLHPPPRVFEASVLTGRVGD